jgi:hypothetical protein
VRHRPALIALHRLRVKFRDITRQVSSLAGASPITPIFVITCNRTASLQRSLDSYQQSLCSRHEIIIHDNASTYPGLLSLLDRMEQSGVKVYRNRVPAIHADQLNNVSDTIEAWFAANKNRALSGYYVVTDPDIALDPLPATLFRRHCDILQFCGFLLDKFPSIEVAGPMLRIDDLPDYYPLKQSVLSIHNKRFWSKRQTPFHWRGIPTAYQRAPIDTTFGVYRRGFKFKRLCQGVRVYSPFSARHLDWYLDPARLTEDQQYYMRNASPVSNWSGTRFFPQADGDHALA